MSKTCLKFKYSIKKEGQPLTLNRHRYRLTIFEQDDKINRHALGNYVENPTVFNGWTFKVSSMVEVRIGLKIVYLIGTGGKEYNQGSFTATEEQADDLIKALEEFRVDYCGQDLIQSNHKLTRIFL